MKRIVVILVLFALILFLGSIVGVSRRSEGFTSVPRRIPRCAIAGLMRRPIDLPLWLSYHRKLGVSRFYIRLEDSPGWTDYLLQQPDVRLEVGSSDKNGNNYETLMERQLSFVNQALQRWAPQDGVEWLFHLDADELLEGDLAAALSSVPQNQTVGVLENYEAVYEGDENSCFAAKTFLRCKSSDCVSYVNGKPVARVLAGVQLAGPHNFSYQGSLDAHTFPPEELRVLHFDSCTLGSWMEKFGHLAVQNRDNNIPFPYYRESIAAAKKAQSVYRAHRGTARVTANKGNELYTRSERGLSGASLEAYRSLLV
jgi:hypothetical protein